MKILKARNGIALVAVLAIMLISSMFIPVMFNLSDTSLMIAVKGTDRQRVSYLARTITEMSVAAFKSFESTEHLRCTATEYVPNTNPKVSTTEGYYIPDGNGVSVCYSCGMKKSEVGSGTTFNNIATQYKKLIDKNDTSVTSIRTDVVVMFQKDNATTKKVYYVQYLDENEEPINDPVKITDIEYRELSQALEEFKAKYPDEPEPYSFPEPEEAGVEDIKYISCSAQKQNPDDANEIPDVKNHSEYTAMVSAGYKEVGRGYCTITYDDSITYYRTNVNTKENKVVDETTYNNGIKDVMNGTTKEYSYSKKENRNVTFESTAEVNGFKSSRKCVLVLPTYPSEENWLQFGIADPNNPGELIASGGNQVFVDPSKATARVPIKYEDNNALSSGKYIYQNLLVYSGVGNMVIRPTSYKNATNENKIEYSGEQNSQFVLGVQPGLNTTPNNDPTYEIIDAVNYENSQEISQMNNFIAFAATNAIQVDMPVNLLLNPCRANRVGDNKFFQSVPNGSLFKIMMFQAPTIQFNERLDMMMSFYVRQTTATDREARRMSSVVLSAPENTPYSYYHKNEKYEKVVKAGMVYFSEDSYLWIIEPGDDGSASSGWGFLAETVYKRDSDFKKIKIASAGDVYYFNSEVKTDSNGDGKLDNKDKDVGFSLTAYFIETKYLPELTSSDQTFWNEMMGRLYSSLITADYTPTYVEDDWYYIGNLNDGSLNMEPPETDGYYTYWVN